MITYAKTYDYNYCSDSFFHIKSLILYFHSNYYYQQIDLIISSAYRQLL